MAAAGPDEQDAGRGRALTGGSSNHRTGHLSLASLRTREHTDGTLEDGARERRSTRPAARFRPTVEPDLAERPDRWQTSVP